MDLDADVAGFWGPTERNTRVANARPPRRKAPFVSPEDIIEISDSSDDERPPAPGPARHRNTPRANSRPRQEPLFLPDMEDLLPDADLHEAAGEPLPLGPEPTASSIRSTPGPDVASLADLYFAQVLEIVPDVCPVHLAHLVQGQSHQPNPLEVVLHMLLEDANYPKAKDKGKGKRKRDDDDAQEEAGPARAKVKIDFASKDRRHTGGEHYITLSIEQLRIDFPRVPVAHLRHTFSKQNSLYAPTYLALQAEISSGLLPYAPLSAPSRSKGKGRQVPRTDAGLEEEKRWILTKQQEETEREDAEVAAQLNEQQFEESGEGIECGCCFSDYPFDKMIQCPDAHLFCMECMSSYASGKLGEHNIDLVCMDQSGCKLMFPESELRRFLSDKLLELYERIKQRKEIEAAGLENLEECPFCEYKVVIENDQEKLFRCERADCGAVSCRECKRLDHLPKSCKEADEDRRLDGRHTVEEAMTKALLRNCPKCSKAFVKEQGCNKMICPHCRTMSCYVCRQIIIGYDHFNQQPPYSTPVDSSKCALWDSVEQRHADEVTAAAKKAMEEYKRAHPEVDDKDLSVELPKPVAGPSNAPRAALQPPGVPIVYYNGMPVQPLQAGGGVYVFNGGNVVVHNAPVAPPPAPLPVRAAPAPAQHVHHRGGRHAGRRVPVVQIPPVPPAVVPPPPEVPGAANFAQLLRGNRAQDLLPRLERMHDALRGVVEGHHRGHARAQQGRAAAPAQQIVQLPPPPAAPVVAAVGRRQRARRH